MKSSNVSKKSSAEILLEAIQDMHAQEQIVTRETLAAHASLADLTKTQIDDRLDYLEGSGRIVRVQRGVYVPAMQHKPSRHMSLTMIPDGTSVFEVGDTVLILTPREYRLAASLLAGGAAQYASIELGRQALECNRDLAGKVSEVARRIDALETA